ncbi:MAG: heavy-metal-associated domain-containing protein [SAR324 cluster bacterium]|nr:heavy-metal-associated domain-containing protein [SAR324 cluster bacterium]
MKKEINIDGMTCQHCVKHVTTALNDIESVTSAVVSLEEKNAVIESSEDLDEKVIAAAIDDAGYTVTAVRTL